MSALLKIYCCILENIEEKPYPLGTLCEPSKAFVCIQQTIHLQKLNTMVLEASWRNGFPPSYPIGNRLWRWAIMLMLNTKQNLFTY